MRLDAPPLAEVVAFLHTWVPYALSSVKDVFLVKVCDQLKVLWKAFPIHKVKKSSSQGFWRKTESSLLGQQQGSSMRLYWLLGSHAPIFLYMSEDHIEMHLCAGSWDRCEQNASSPGLPFSLGS